MRRVILFSNFSTLSDKDGFLKALFPDEMKQKKFGYIPPDGMQKSFYADVWKDCCSRYKADFSYIDIESPHQQSAILDSNILLFTGGNTFQLLDNLHKNALFETVKEFTNKDEFVIAGFSAGALLLTPTIQLAEDEDENVVDIQNLEGLGLVDFEIYPHYTENKKEFIEKYTQEMERKVVPIRDEEFIVMDL